MGDLLALQQAVKEENIKHTDPIYILCMCASTCSHGNVQACVLYKKCINWGKRMHSFQKQGCFMLCGPERTHGLIWSAVISPAFGIRLSLQSTMP